MSDPAPLVVLGIPIPSADPLFLGLVGVHVPLGLAAVTAGALAMFSRKGRGRHSRWGTIYFWCLAGVFATMAALSVMRWADDYPLFILGALAFALANLGRQAARRQWPHWVLWHLPSMGFSYALMVTAFYVDNARFLPLWKALPPIVFWVLPGLIALALILNAVASHPVVDTMERRRQQP
jgi:hypothetical protein